MRQRISRVQVASGEGKVGKKTTAKEEPTANRTTRRDSGRRDSGRRRHSLGWAAFLTTRSVKLLVALAESILGGAGIGGGSSPFSIEVELLVALALAEVHPCSPLSPAQTAASRTVHAWQPIPCNSDMANAYGVLESLTEPVVHRVQGRQ